MKVTLAHPISTMSGSVDHQTGAKPRTVKTSGLTFFVWKGLQLARMLVLPANPRSIFQAAVRNVQTGLSRAWSATLDAEQRLAWKAWATLHSYVDGFQAFQATAWAPYAYDGTLVEDAPAATAPAFAATLASATYDINAQNYRLCLVRRLYGPGPGPSSPTSSGPRKVPGAQAVRETDYTSAGATLPLSIILDTDPTVEGFLSNIAAEAHLLDTALETDRRYCRATVYDLASGQRLLRTTCLVTMAA